MANPVKPILNDPYIDGKLVAKSATCLNCQMERRWGVTIQNVTLPQGVVPSEKLILFYMDHGMHESTLKPLPFIGITCGCYAKAHRQIAHIQGQLNPNKYGSTSKNPTERS